MPSVAHLAQRLQQLLTVRAAALARTTGFVQRARALTGSHFAQTLVWGWLANPEATLSQLQQMAATVGAAVSRVAVHQRFSDTAAVFLDALLTEAVQTVLSGDPVALPLVARFPGGVYVLDSTTVSLPAPLATLWPGCGGSGDAGAAALKIAGRLNLATGDLDVLGRQAGRPQDQDGASQTAPVPPAGLRLHDLGFFSLPVLRTIQDGGGHYLCRPKLHTRVRDARGRRWTLRTLLTTHCPTTLDWPIQLGVHERLPCRLLAERVPPAVAALRQQRLVEEARRDGKRPSADQLALTHWTVYVTSLPPAQLTLAEALVL